MTNTYLFWIFMLDYSKGWGIRRHTHEYYQLYYISYGEGSLLLGNETLNLSEGMTIIIYPNQVHELFRVREGVLRMIDVKFYLQDPELIEEICKIPQCTFMDRSLGELLITARDEWKSTRPFKQNLSNILLEQCLYSIIRTQAQIHDTRFSFRQPEIRLKNLSSLARNIALYVQKNCFEELSLDQMAEELNYNKNYLCKVFKQSTGITIINYANYLRISKSLELICYTSEKLNDIAELCGFSDVHYFARIFKKMTGHTPGEMRNQNEYNMYTDILKHGKFRYRYYEPIDSAKADRINS